MPLIQDKDYILFFSSKILLESVLDEFGDEGAMFSSATKMNSDFAKILNLPLFSKAIVAASIKLSTKVTEMKMIQTDGHNLITNYTVHIVRYSGC